MPLAPYKDRTIRLTLENTYFKQNPLTETIKTVVDLYLPSVGIGRKVKSLLPSAKGSITLVGPTSMNVDITANIGDEQGIATSFLQPWSINNIPVKIRGESYLGAFEGLSVSDNDAPDLLAMFYQSLRDFSSHLGKMGTKERVVLEVSNNPSGSSRFLGFIKQLSITEDVKKPYILDYDLTFIGKNFDDMSIALGKQRGDTDNRFSLGSG